MRRFIIFPIVATALLLSGPARATIIHIPGDYPTIQEGINASADGDTVLVADGIYFENINFLGKAILLTSENGPDYTTIEIQTTSVPVVIFNNNEGRNSVLSGFTVDGDSSYWGILCVSASPTIYENVIKNHEAGIKVEGGGPLIRKNDICFCDHSDVGPHVSGGINLNGSNAVIDSNVIHHNEAHVAAAVSINLSDNVVMERNLIFSNVASGYIGGVVLNNSNNLDFINNTVVQNSTQDLDRASITYHHCNDVVIINNIVSFNDELGIWDNGDNSSVTFDYNDVYGNDAGDFHGIGSGPNGISEDPLFVDLNNDDYHLQEGSPCIDAGDPDSPLDPDGTIADMGAFYYFGGTTTFGLDIADIYGENGQPATIPVSTFGLNEQEIAGVEFHIGYDDICLQYESVSSDYLADLLVNVVDGEIHILWEDYLNPVLVPDSAAILGLEFAVLGHLGDSCLIQWSEGNEMVDPSGEVIADLNWVDGSVNVVEFHNISGKVVYYDLETPVPGVTVELSGDYSATEITDENGAYGFEDLFPGSFMICPSRVEEDAGVTVTDIVNIRRHIVWLALFGSPYQLVAADVNQSGGVSVADVIKLRRYLAELNELPGGNWAFVDSSFAITDENWSVAPRCIEFDLWDADLTDSSFVGMRMGDVDYSWAQGIRGISPPKMAGIAVLDLADCYGLPGDTVRMSVNVAGFTGVAGLELHFAFPSEDMSLIGIGSHVMADPTTNGVNGEVHFVWEDIFNIVSLGDGEEVVSIAFEILEGASDSMPVSFTAAHMTDEEGADFTVISMNGHVIRGQTPNDGGNTILPESYRLSQNYPNPFNAKTLIEFDLPEPSHVTLEIYNVLGRRIAILADRMRETGYHRITWNASEQPSGIYFYRITANSFADTKKMLLLK